MQTNGFQNCLIRMFRLLVVQYSPMKLISQDLRKFTFITRLEVRKKDINEANFKFDGDDEPVWSVSGKERQDRESLEALINQYEGVGRDKKIVDVIDRGKARSRAFIKNKVIERKFFRNTPQCNILTWRAKCQIKYLYDQEQDEDAILDVFPITRMALRQILHNKKVMKNDKEILNHDRAVFQRWRNLLDRKVALSESMKQTLSELKESGQIDKLVNANGVDDLPDVAPPTLHDLAHQRPPTDGQFLQIYQKHTRHDPNTVKSLPKDRNLLSADDIQQVLHELQSRFMANSENEAKNHAYIPQREIRPHFNDLKSKTAQNETLSSSLHQVGKEFIDESGDVIFRIP